MRFRLSYFLVLCVLLGGVVVPVAWRHYQESTADRSSETARVAEMTQLEEDLVTAERALEASVQGDVGRHGRHGLVGGFLYPSQTTRRLHQRVETLELRLARLKWEGDS